MSDFLSRPSPEVAPDLLGCLLSSHTPHGTVAVVLTEVEAYEGEVDPASHAHRGETARNAVMFGPAGRVYVYRSHGIHWCMNIVTGTSGAASAVLLRAGRVVQGEDLARARRGEHVDLRSLARGPGNLARALGITGADNRVDLVAGERFQLHRPPLPIGPAVSGPRVGVTLAAEVPWRWTISGDPTVSAYRRSPRAVRPTPPPG
nr:DNA-3-methyladenine glycosylase [Nocardioides gilvus]